MSTHRERERDGSERDRQLVARRGWACQSGPSGKTAYKREGDEMASAQRFHTTRVICSSF